MNLKRWSWHQILIALSWGAGFGAGGVLTYLAPDLVAQFICGGSVTGAPPQASGGATAAGSTTNVACGTTANASGTVSGNTALGNF